MRIDLFLSGAFFYRARKADAEPLFLLLQGGDFSPKLLKRDEKTGEVTFFLSRKESERFAQAAKEKKLNFTAQARGLPAVLQVFLSAPGLLVGVLLALLLAVGARAVLWDVRIAGNESMDTGELEDLLAQSGLSVGMLLPSLDADEVALALRRADARVAYAAVNVVGTVAYVQIREAEPAPEKSVKNPANLVAKRDGVVTMPLVFEGECLVVPGQIVRAGQILASGLSDTQNHGYLVTRAAGQVLARTVHTYEVRVPFSYEEKAYTGREKHELSLLFFGRAQKVFKNTGKTIDKCDIIEKTTHAMLPTGEKLPFGYSLVTVAEYQTLTLTRSATEARDLAQAQLQAKLAADGAGRTLLEKHVEYRVDGEGITLLCTVVCEENIASVSEFTLHP